AMFPHNDLVPLLTSSVGLLLVLMYFPGGLAQLGYLVRNAVDEWAVRRLPPAADEAAERPPVAAFVSARADGPGDETADLHEVLRAEHIVVRFGGNVAVSDATVRVSRGEIVGLIGTNGAGKSTFLNAIGGYVPARGSVELLGRDISSLGVSARARLGLGRTFQTALLFPELSVRETIQVALE